MGTGTSTGVPVLGCTCAVCTSSDPRDQRLRPSVLVQWRGLQLQVDVGPDFRLQALRYGIQRLDAVFLTHAHADHINGLDDLRPLTVGGPLPVYGEESTLLELERRFGYMFTREPSLSSRPLLDFRPMPSAVDLGRGCLVRAVPVCHGPDLILGFRFGPLAYLTDCSAIPASSYRLLEGIHTLVIDGLRPTPHPTHFSFDQALKAAEPLQPKQIWLIHLSHDLLHTEIEALLGDRARAAWDGLILDLPD